MRVRITERRCSVPSRVLERTEGQIEALSKYDARATAAEVVFAEEKLVRTVEILIRIDGVEPVIAHGEGSDFRTALDQGLDRIRRMLRKRRERRRDHQAPPLAERVEKG